MSVLIETNTDRVLKPKSDEMGIHTAAAALMAMSLALKNVEYIENARFVEKTDQKDSMADFEWTIFKGRQVIASTRELLVKQLEQIEPIVDERVKTLLNNNPTILPVLENDFRREVQKPNFDNGFQFIRNAAKLQALAELLSQIEDMDPREVAIHYIFLLVGLMAIEKNEIEMERLAEVQKLQQEVSKDFDRLLYLIRQIKANAGENGVGSDKAEELARQLQITANKLFGKDIDWKDVDGTFYIIPEKGSSLDRLLRAIEADGEDIFANPVYNMINNFALQMDEWGPPVDRDTSIPADGRPTRSFLDSLIYPVGDEFDSLVKWVNVMGSNWHWERRGESDGQVDYAGIMDTQAAAATTSLTTFGQQVTITAQGVVSEIETFNGIVRKTMEQIADFIKGVNNSMGRV